MMSTTPGITKSSLPIYQRRPNAINAGIVYYWQFLQKTQNHNWIFFLWTQQIQANANLTPYNV